MRKILGLPSASEKESVLLLRYVQAEHVTMQRNQISPGAHSLWHMLSPSQVRGVCDLQGEESQHHSNKASLWTSPSWERQSAMALSIRVCSYWVHQGPSPDCSLPRVLIGVVAAASNLRESVISVLHEGVVASLVGKTIFPTLLPEVKPLPQQSTLFIGYCKHSGLVH